MLYRRCIFLITAAFCLHTLSGQDVVFKVEVSADTLYFGNYLGIKYTIENTQGDFQAPDFEGFLVAGGPTAVGHDRFR